MIVYDIEVIPAGAPDPRWVRPPWNSKDKEAYRRDPENLQKEFLDRSKNKPHMSQVISIAWRVVGLGDDPSLPCEVYSSANEGDLLDKVKTRLVSLIDEGHTLVAWNGDHYDTRFLAWAAMRNGVFDLSRSLNVKGSKPWEHKFADPSRSFGQYTSLEEAAFSMGIEHPSPKAGAKVYDWFLAGNWDAIDAHAVHDVNVCSLISRYLVEAGMMLVAR